MFSQGMLAAIFQGMLAENDEDTTCQTKETRETERIKFHRRTVSLDIKDLKKDDIKSLHDDDPFMYYSIPGIHKATMHGKPVNHSDMNELCQSEVLQDEPSHRRTNSMVDRRTRISFEADPLFLMMEVLLDEDESDDDDESEQD